MRAPILKQASHLVNRASFALDSCSTPNCKLYHRPRSVSTRQDEALQVALSAVRHSSSSKAREKKRAEDRDFIVSVLEASATRRDAKGYLQKYAPQSGDGVSKKRKPSKLQETSDQTYSSIRVVNQSPKFIQGNQHELAVPLEEPVNLAIVKMALPQNLDDKTLGAIAKTFSQLRKLGLVSLIVLDGGVESSRKILREQSWRIQQAIENFGEPGSILLDQCVAETEPHMAKGQGFMPSGVYIQYPHLVLRALQDNAIVVIPPVTMAPDMKCVKVVDADETIVALTKYFSGLQFNAAENSVASPKATCSAGMKVASVEKVIILDPVGGTPLADEHDSCHRYINLEQEFEGIMQNPLIHNLLTDKPVFSSSLPIERVRSGNKGDRVSDLPRLVHLINDSFNRELDVQHYLDRVNENLAGIIIAGEYEGGAILTWEKPFGLDDETAYKTGRLVPYLDKFAVLKSRQGSGGVADVVFNAMVRGCFPEGLCWRSRQDNPVNKWYFERSLGTWQLKDTNWTMFWTTPHLPLSDPKLLDYENVCRHIEPSIQCYQTQLPPDYIDLEKRVDALKQVHQKMLAVTSQYSNEAYDYPPNIKETFQDLGRTVSEKVTLLSAAGSPAEAQAALTAPPTAKPQPKTFNHAIARASLASSQVLHQQHTGAGEDPLATALEKYALAMERVGEARMAQDAQIQSRFLAGWNTTLNTNLMFATRARKNVENSRLTLDAAKARAHGTTWKLGPGSQRADEPQTQELSPEAQEEIEKAEDEFVTQTEEAVGVMKNVLDTPEPLRNLADLIAAQIEYHKRAYEILSELAPIVDGLQVEQEASYRKSRESAS
ncbi:acetylglutamate synthase [Colletotrichum truncatum]|uniref:Acetylglutamate synthase n=1 Tax=Colletotrichum truncatum TaxID=5467 RepID=A0ACC3ZJC8_COLTU